MTTVTLLPRTLIQHRTRQRGWPNIVLWLLCCLPLLHVYLLVRSAHAGALQATSIQFLRPLATSGAAGMLFYAAYLEQGHKRWAWFCDGAALGCAAAFSFLKITQDATIATLSMRLLWIWIYLFSFAGTALYLQKRTWWVGSTWRIIVAGLTVGISTLVMMQTLLPTFLPAWPWTAHAQSVTPSLAFDIGIIFAFGIVGMRYKHNSRPLVHRHLHQPGQRWRTRGHLFKDAGWRRVNLVGVWGVSAKESLIVITDLPPQWSVLRLYERRFWIEAGFRSDKRKGWQGEASQVQGLQHHERLVLGMAWASVVVLCLGVAEAHQRVSAAQARSWRKRVRQVRHARESIFTLGLYALRSWLFGTARGTWQWSLPELDAPSWERRWYHWQSCRLISYPPVRP